MRKWIKRHLDELFKTFVEVYKTDTWTLFQNHHNHNNRILKLEAQLSKLQFKIDVLMNVAGGNK